jgi:outer membrane receptor protein involved in Fe transport
MNDLKPRVARVADSQIALGRLVLTATAAACAAILSVDFAAAQDDEEPQSRELDELVVTARFREESLQETPLAITAISGETLSENGATTVIDIADWAPNVVMDQLGSGWGPTLAASVRGLGYGDFKATSEPTVTIYVDDVVLGRPTAATLDLLDLERVEVLRGPQGTLFGKNAIGGVVRMISRKPGEGDTQGDVELTVGTYDRLDVRGSFETALIEETLFARVSYASKRREGWQDNVDFRCDMLQRGTPQLAGLNDGIVGWTRDPDGPTGNDPNNTIPAMGGRERRRQRVRAANEHVDARYRPQLRRGTIRRREHRGRTRHPALRAERPIRAQFGRGHHGSGSDEPLRPPRKRESGHGAQHALQQQRRATDVGRSL